MRRLLPIAAIPLFLTLTAFAQSPPDAPLPSPSSSSDWEQVQGLGDGEEISVESAGHLPVRCRFAGATADLLFCDSRFFWAGRAELRFGRNQLETVRLDRRRRNRWLITGAAAAAGFGYGYAQKPVGIGTPRAADAFVLGGFSALGGYFVGLAVTPFLPGKLIFRQRSAQP